MPRMARIVVPNYPHHITQRGNRRQRTFFSDDDYLTYLRLLKNAVTKAGVSVWAYCLMPNHVHLVLVPQQKDSLSKLFKDAHLKYTRHINSREGWQGHLWQERFHSFVMDEHHLLAAVRYIELNPVRAQLCKQPEDWPWSSIHAHLGNKNDQLVYAQPLLSRVGNWLNFLAEDDPNTTLEDVRAHLRTGRPGGDRAFISMIEEITGG